MIETRDELNFAAKLSKQAGPPQSLVWRLPAHFCFNRVKRSDAIE